jgi:hypothetical protein
MTAHIPLFEFEQQTYTWQHVVRAAKLRGDWQVIYTQTAQQIQHINTAPAPSALDIQAAQRDFYFRHHLHDDAALTAWLQRWQITAEEWQQHLIRTCATPTTDTLFFASPEKHDLPSTTIDRAIYVDLVAQQKLRPWIFACAGRLALQPALQSLYTDATLGTRTQLILEAAGLSIHEAMAQAQAEALYEVHSEHVAQSPRIDEIITRQQHAWTRFQYQALRFLNEKKARHASHCLLGDSITIRDLARITNAHVVNGDCYFEELPKTFRYAFTHAQSGDLLPTLAHNDDYWVVAITHRTTPSKDCPLTRLRALEEALASDVDHACRQRVIWLNEN